MKEINISFKELMDYVRDKDFEISRLRFCVKELTKENDELRLKEKLMSDWLIEHNIILTIERNKVIQVED